MRGLLSLQFYGPDRSVEGDWSVRSYCWVCREAQVLFREGV